MEPIINAPGTIKGIEVLFFEEAEVTKLRNGQPSFATFGPMNVLYFPQYNRFILQINDWRYPLLRRLSIDSDGNGCYNLPGPNGATFNLKVTKPGQSLNNLGALLDGVRKLEASPDDKLVRMPMKKPSDTGVKEVIVEAATQTKQKVQNKIATAKTGTKHLTSTKKRVNLKDIKNKNFKKEAHSRIKKDFFKSTEKLSNEFIQRRRDNVNLAEPKLMDDMRKTSNAAVFHIPQLEIEEAILNAKDIMKAPMTEKKGGIMQNLMEGVQHAKEALTGMVSGDRRNAPEVQKAPMTEGMTHYQG